MTPEEIRTIALLGGDNAVYNLHVTNTLTSESYHLSVGTSNPAINPALSFNRNPARKPLAERTPSMHDLRVLRMLRDDCNSMNGFTVEYLPEAPTLSADEPRWVYRTSSEFLIDLEACGGKFSTLLGFDSNFKLALSK